MGIRAIIGVVLLLMSFCAGFYVKGLQSERYRLEQDNAQIEKQLKLIDSLRKREGQLTRDIEIIRNQRDENEAILRAAIDQLDTELRKRPARPTGKPSAVPNNPSAVPAAAGCDGSRLYEQDSRFLVGEAAQCTTTQQYLRECRQAVAHFNNKVMCFNDPASEACQDSVFNPQKDIAP
ncbi:MAG TPA: hypothetical protein VFV57_05930 [Limnobacter sp.]|nr:hypothetical protein [Limnobacter sp.]